MQLLVNHGSSDIPTGWTFSIQNPNYLGIYGAWNWVYSGVDSTGNATGYANQVIWRATHCLVLSDQLAICRPSKAWLRSAKSSLHTMRCFLDRYPIQPYDSRFIAEDNAAKMLCAD